MAMTIGVLILGSFCMEYTCRRYGITRSYEFLVWWLVWIGYGYIVFLFIPPGVEALFALFFGSILLMGATIDKHLFILPDEGAICLLIGGLLRIGGGFGGEVYSILSAALLGIFFYFLQRISHNGVGDGDIKWAIAIGLWIDPFYSFVMLVVAFSVGSLALPIVMAYQKKCIKRIPFGPFLNLGAAFAFIAPHLPWFTQWLRSVGYIL